MNEALGAFNVDGSYLHEALDVLVCSLEFSQWVHFFRAVQASGKEVQAAGLNS